MSALRQAKCGYLVWIPKMRNHQLFLRERQEAIFAHIQGNWKSSKAMKVYSFADKQRFRQTVQNFSPNVHFAPNLMKGDPDQSFKSFKILINPSKSANSDQFANLPPQPGPRRSEILRLWKLFSRRNQVAAHSSQFLCGSRDSGRLALYNAQLLKYHV